MLFLDLPDLSAADGEKTQSRSRRAIGESEKPVAKLIPAADGLIDLFGYMAGTIQIVGDIVGPLDVEWTGDGENL